MIYKMYYLSDGKHGIELRPIKTGIMLTLEPEFDQMMSYSVDLSTKDVEELIFSLQDLIS